MSGEEVIKVILDEVILYSQDYRSGNAYKTCLAHRLRQKGLFVETEKPVPVVFEEIKMECGYRADPVAERKIIVDTKNIEAIADIHIAQLLTYLRF